ATQRITLFIEQNKKFIMEHVQRSENSVATFDLWESLEHACNRVMHFGLELAPVRWMMDVPKNATTTSSQYCVQHVEYLRINTAKFLFAGANWLAGNIGWFGTGAANFFKTTMDLISGLGDF